MATLNQGERFCVECEYKWVDEDTDFKLCPKCGSASVIRPDRVDTGVKILEIRCELFQLMKPLFMHTKELPEFAEMDANKATEQALGLLLKRLVH